MAKTITIIGSSGALGRAFVEQYANAFPQAKIHAFSRTPTAQHPNVSAHAIDYADEASIAKAAELASADGPIDLVIVATGILHDDSVQPEKSLRDLNAENFQHIYAANTIFPALVAKHFLPKLNRGERSVFAVLSAWAGSVTHNDTGGWYAYRASKAALNMVLKNASIEVGRRNKQAVIVGLDPGTVDSKLSEPFKKYIPSEKLFSAELATQKLVAVIDGLNPADTGKCFTYDGSEVQP